MDETRIDGVAAAIQLLQAIARSEGPIASARLAGVPRSSLYRIARTLEAAGLVGRRRGMMDAGPLAEALIAGHVQRLRSEPIDRGLRPRAVHISEDEGAADEPIALSKPRCLLRSGRNLRIGFSNMSLDNPWRVALVHSVERATANLGGGIARLTVRHAGNDAAIQAADIRALAADGVDGLIVSAMASPLVRAAMEEAMAAGIELVLVDRRMRDIAPTSFVSTSDAAIGRTTALWLAETLGGAGAVLLLPGSEEAEPAQRRLDAALAVFAAFPGIEILGQSWTGWQRQRGHAAALAAIERFGRRIAGVWCDSGLQGVGSMQAFLDAGWKAGRIPPHTGGDLNLAYKLAIRHDIRLAAVDYPPAMGMRAVDVLFQALRGRYVPSRVDVPLEVILTEGSATPSVAPELWAEAHVRWDLPDDLVLASGLGPAYNPHAFRIHYPGNSYNRSAAARQGA